MRAASFILACASVAFTLSQSPATFAEEGTLKWEEISELPNPTSKSEQIGLAGHFGGVHNGTLIIAGGANFPEGAPWKNGVKTFWNDIFVLEKDGGSGKTKWVSEVKTKLPKPIAYGVSVSTDAGVLCIGGADGTQCYADVFFLKWNAETRGVEIENLPPLPTTLAHMTAAKVGNIVYVAGGVTSPFGEGTKSFFALDLEPAPVVPEPEPSDPDKPSVNPPETPETPDPSSDSRPSPAGSKNPDTGEELEKPEKSETKTKTESESEEPNTDESEPAPIKPEVIGDDSPEPIEPIEPAEPAEPAEPVEPAEPEPISLEWKEMIPWDGGPRAFAASAAQSDGEKECFFLFSGRNPQPNGTSSQLFDSYKYDPTADQWVKFPDIALPDSDPRSVVAASAIATGKTSILIFGGDDGTMAKVSALLVSASNSTSRDAYLKLNETILENHPGYSRDILSLDTVDGVWSNIATFPESCPVTTPAFVWDSKIIIPSGEISPGVRSPKIWSGTWTSKE